jgi:hypothetical protein
MRSIIMSSLLLFSSFSFAEEKKNIPLTECEQMFAAAQNSYLKAKAAERILALLADKFLTEKDPAERTKIINEMLQLCALSMNSKEDTINLLLETMYCCKVIPRT